MGLTAARVPFTLQALTNYPPVLAAHVLGVAAAVLAFLFRRHGWIRVVTTGAILASLTVEGLLLYPNFMVLDAWTAMLLGSGLITAVVATNSVRTTRLPWRIAFASFCLLSSGSIFSSISLSPVQGWILPMGVAGTLLLLGEIYGRLHDAQKAAVQAHRQHAEVSAKLARASAEILDIRHRESLAIIASGIAHEVNNPVTYLSGNLDLLEEQLAAAASDPETQHLLEAMRKGIESIGVVVDRVRTIYREAKAPPKHVSLRQAADLAIVSLPSQARHYVTVTNHVASDAIVPAHPADVYIVMSNLLRNGLEAAADRSDAAVSVSAPADSDTTRLVVTDNGTGMTAGEIERCTDPFYTSKSERGGMGVGLSLVQAIAERTGGRLEFQSVPGEGTTASYVFGNGGSG